MKQGIIIWVLGNEEKITKAGEVISRSLRNIFPTVVSISEKDVKEGLCLEKEGTEVRSSVASKMGWICNFLEKNGVAVVALSSNTKREERDAVRKKAGAMVEVIIKGETPPALEPPFYPEIELTEGDNSEQIESMFIQALKSIGILDSFTEQYSKDEENQIKDRLEKLGYL